jgi:putative transposase
MFTLTRLGRLLQQLPRAAFQQAVEQHRADRHTKGFTCWDHLVAMVHSQLSGAGSLRELEAAFNQHCSARYHLGTRAIRRSTLADANQRRNPAVFAQLAQALMAQAGRHLRGRHKPPLLLLDSTSIALRGRGHEWVRANSTRTPGLKLHLMIDCASGAPRHHSITAANVNDIEEGRKAPLERGAIYVFDKGYCGYRWWSRIDAIGSRFVTRLKTNAAMRVLRAMDCAGQEVLADEIVEFTHRSNRGRHRNAYTQPLRRLLVQDPRQQPPRVLVLVTNDLEAPAADIAQHYKDRWQIEVLFKWIKQHLRIKRFLGQSENAVRIQLLTALIAYLLVLLDHWTNRQAPSLWLSLDQLRGGLFHRPESDDSRWERRRKRRACRSSGAPAWPR